MANIILHIIHIFFEILQVQHLVTGEVYNYTSKPKYLDLDYIAEEAAKEEIFKNEQYDSTFRGAQKYWLTAEIMLENNPIWKEFWNEWKVKEMTVINHITDVKPLCKLTKNNKVLVDCNATSSSIFSCVDVEKGTVTKCNSSKNAAYTVPVCLEVC